MSEESPTAPQELTEEEKQQIVDLLKKLASMNIDVSKLTEQAPEIYEQIKNAGIDLGKYGISEQDVGGIFGIFQKIWNAILSLFGR